MEQSPSYEQIKDQIKQVLEAFDKVDLDGLERVKLLKRNDSKYVVPIEAVPALLQKVSQDYLVLTIGDRNSFAYETLYFDTDDFQLYRLHHNSKPVRHKVRFRTYLDSGLTYLEVKTRTRLGRTEKKRLKRQALEADLSSEALQFVDKHVPGIAHSPLRRKTRTRFERITLAHRHLPERVTIDLGIRFGYPNDGENTVIPFIALIEVKQQGRWRSAMTEVLRSHRAVMGAFSKYCIGSAILYTDLKYNRFKPQLTVINRIRNGYTK